MKLVYRCSSCKRENELPFSSSDRGELSREVGEVIKSFCNHCATINHIKVNAVRAKRSKSSGLIFVSALLLSIFFGFLSIQKLWTNDLGRNLDALIVFGAAIALPFIIAGVWVKSVDKSIKHFNDYYV